MARLNIEDSLFKNDSFQDLLIVVGDRYKALGMVVSGFMLAQKFWLSHHGIPKDAWPETLDPLVKTRLARVQADGTIYVSGSKESFAWLEQKSEAGKSKSPEKTKHLKQNRTKTERAPNGEPNAAEALSLTLSPSLSLTPDQPQSLSPLAPKRKAKASAPTGTNEVIALYCDLWKQTYNSKRSPDVVGQEAGRMGRLVKELGQPRVEALLHAYFKMKDPWFVTKSHDVGSLIANLNKVGLAADNDGRMITRSEINQIDKQTTNQNTLEALRKGQI